MRRSVEQILIGPEDFLCTVTVVHVEIDDGHPFEPMLFASIMRGDGDVVEDPGYEATLIANLHAQAVSIQNLCALVPVVLDPLSPHYNRCVPWCP